MMNKIMMGVILMVLLAGFIGNECYKDIKSTKFKNDERWKLIQSKANQVTFWYHRFLILMLSVPIVLDIFYHYQISFSLSQITEYLLVVLFLPYAIELIYLIYLNKKM